MKINRTIILAILAAMFAIGTVRGATNEISALLQKGLFEEEANHNLEAAIQAYQAVITQTEKDRQFAATAVFRLGECYRKQGKTNDANVQYQRILSDFSDQTELATASRTYLGTTATPTGAPLDPTRRVTELPPGFSVPPEEQELKRIQAMIKDSPDLINGQRGQNVPLIDAVSRNLPTVVRFLLDNKADIDAKNNGQTALTVASENGNKEMVELLADHGADVNKPDDGQRDTPLHLAAQRGYKAIAEVLLSHKAEPNCKDASGATPLHLAAQGAFLSFVQLLLTNGANVNSQTEIGETPLHFAAAYDNQAIIELLLAHKADVNARTHNGGTPLITAVQFGRLMATKALLAGKADVNVQLNSSDTPSEYKGRTALIFAVLSGQAEMVKLLLDNKADTEAKANSFSANSPSGGSGSRPGGPSPSAHRNYAYITSLGIAVVTGKNQIAELLLDHGADINAQDAGGDTPLSLAVQLARGDMVEWLLGRGAAVQTTNREQLSPLILAVRGGLPDVVKQLLAHKPDLKAVDNYGATALQNTLFINNSDQIAGLLLDGGAKPDVRFTNDYAQRLSNPYGMSPLNVAVQNGYKEMVAVLLAHHADPNFQSFNGLTPLATAKAFAGNRTVSEENRQKYRDIVTMLEQAGGNDRLQRLSAITVRRHEGDWGIPNVFLKGTNGFNQYSLFDLLANYYAPADWYRNHLPPGGRGSAGTRVDSVPGLPFPDFSRIRINRLDKNGRTNSISLDLADALASGDCSKDVPLQWGDIVEIPETDHNVDQVWQGLDDQPRATLAKCLTRNVAIVVKGHTNVLALQPIFFRLDEVVQFPAKTGQKPRINFGSMPPKTELVSFWLYDVVDAADVLLTSSDLSRVKVRRVDPATRKTVEMVFNLEKNNPQNPFWLRDGDIIEIPEKP